MQNKNPGLIANLRQALDTWDRHRTELAQLSIRREGDWRRPTVQYRRLLQEDIARIAMLSAELNTDGAGTAELRSFRAALSAVRSRVAEHQASWPVVAIDPDDAGYEQSVVRLRAANDDFAATAARFLAHLLSDA